MHQVFISYSSVNKWVADAICNRLESGNIKCWYAPRDISGGEEWAGAIVKAIQQAQVFILVYSQDSNRSKQVLREVSTAVGSNCVIIPFRIDDTMLDGSMAYYLSSLHWLDAMNTPLENSIYHLHRRVYALLTADPSAQTQPAPALRKKRAKVPWWIWPVIAALLAGLAFGAAKLLPPPEEEPEPAATAPSTQPADTAPAVPATTDPVAPQVPVLTFQDISVLMDFRYPFNSTAMFAQDQDAYFVEDARTGNLVLAKTTTGYRILDDIEYSFQTPTMMLTVYLDHYDTVYFIDMLEFSVQTFHRPTHSWLCREPVKLALEPGEFINDAYAFNQYMAGGLSHQDEIVLFISDKHGTITKAITLYPDCTAKVIDLQPLQLVDILCGTDLPDNIVLGLDTALQLVALNISTMQVVETAPQVIREAYLPYNDAGSSTFSPNGRYMLTSSGTGLGTTISAWDLSLGKTVFDYTFLENYDCSFLSDDRLAYFDQETASVNIYDLQTKKRSVLFRADDFLDRSLFLDSPFYCQYNERLQVFFFFSSGADAEGNPCVQLTMADQQGNIIACSEPVITPYDNYRAAAHVTQQTILFELTASEPLQVDINGIKTHMYCISYSYGSDGSLIFGQ